MTDVSTPRPWKIHKGDTVLGGPNNVGILCDYEYGIDRETAIANAALIVRAVNAHDDLVIAAKDAVILLVEIAKLPGANRMASGSVVLKLIAAIKKAEEDQP